MTYDTPDRRRAFGPCFATHVIYSEFRVEKKMSFGLKWVGPWVP